MKFLLAIFIFLIFIPQNVSAETCGVFQKRVNGKCVKFEVPSNAHLTYSGNSWDCNRGFKLSEDKTRCEEMSEARAGALKIPENGKAASTYDGWLCNDEYTKNYKENTCIKNK